MGHIYILSPKGYSRPILGKLFLKTITLSSFCFLVSFAKRDSFLLGQYLLHPFANILPSHRLTFSSFLLLCCRLFCSFSSLSLWTMFVRVRASACASRLRKLLFDKFIRPR